MKIAIITDGIYPFDKGGHQIRIYNLVKNYTSGNNVDVYVQQKPNTEYPDTHAGARIKEVNSRFFDPRVRLSVGGLSYYREVKTQLDNDYDVIDVSFYAPTESISTPTISTYGAFIQQWYDLSNLREKMISSPPIAIQYFLNRWTISGSDSIICLSDKSKQELNHYFNPSVPTHVIKNGVNENKFTKEGKSKNFNDLGERTALYAGRLHRKKGLYELIDAFSSIEYDIGLIIAGDGPARNDLEDMVNHNNMNDSVEFVGNVDYEQMPTYYRAADIFYLPSYFEIQPLSCLEAMACGIPVVATDIPGVRELVDDYQNGILVKPGSVQEIVNATSLLLNDKQLRQKLVRNGLKFSEKRTWKKIADDTLNIYTQVLD